MVSSRFALQSGRLHLHMGDNRSIFTLRPLLLFDVVVCATARDAAVRDTAFGLLP